MGFELTQHDVKLLSRNVLDFSYNAVSPASGFPVDGGIIDFQFPPIIKTDTKAAKWQPMYNNPGHEPQYMYQGATPRKMSITTTYIVGGPIGQGVGSWTTAKTAKQKTIITKELSKKSILHLLKLC